MACKTLSVSPAYSFIRESGVYRPFLSVSPAYNFIRESGVQFYP
jgi:hypothetical protein